MIRRKKLVMILILVLIVAIAVISVGYAALNSVLNITVNKTVQSPMSWDIGFRPETVEGYWFSYSMTGSIDCGTATATTTTVSGITPTFNVSTGYCKYTMKVLNNGTIGGKISNIIMTPPSNASCTTGENYMTCGNVKYSLNVSVGNVIPAKSGNTATERSVELKVEHLNSDTAAYSQTGFAFQIVYAQN